MSGHNLLRTLVLAGCLAALAWSCADPTPGGSSPPADECSRDEECTLGQMCSAGQCVAITPTDVGMDTEEDTVDEEEPEPDAEPDAEDEDDIGEPCDTGEDCRSGYCIEVPEQGTSVCTDFCGEGTCPDGYVCAPLANAGNDRVFLCFPETDFLCQPCDTDAECGGLSDRCIPYGDDEGFCGKSCADEDCPDGYSCIDVEVDGETYQQCRNDDGFCCDETNGGDEACDQVDNDCDGFVDEDFDLSTDVDNCGACNRVCDLNNAIAECEDRECAIFACAQDWYNIANGADDGCEYNCVFAGAEQCNDVDDDCDGLIDEDFRDDDGVYTLDLDHCGACNQPCAVLNGVAACNVGVCERVMCNDTHDDCDDEPLDCERPVSSDPENCGACDYSCNDDWPGGLNGITACNNNVCQLVGCQDPFDNCVTLIDDGCETNTTTSIDHCISCGNACEFLNAEAMCTPSGCAPGDCVGTWFDLDGLPGCEYDCGRTTPAATDEPDDAFDDANCDGIDGDVSRAVFVRSGASDSNTGLTPDQPVGSWGRAFSIAGSNGSRDQILIATGSYTGGTLSAPDGVSVYGGYSNDFRSRSNSRSVYMASTFRALRVQFLTQPVIFDRIELVVGNQSTGNYALGVEVTSSGDNFTMSRSVVTVGTGGTGNGGDTGSSGSDGADGANGSGSSGGGGPGNGGNGANGRRHESGLSGQSGSNNGANCDPSSTPRGQAGSGAPNNGCFDGDAARGGDATDGCPGRDGGIGPHGDNVGSWAGTSWLPDRGSTGGSGFLGGGGGGGGSGAGEECVEVCTPFGCICEPFCGTGRGGGGGGQGGGGGGGGTGGFTGGASVGIVVSNSTITLDDTDVTTAGGGRGGNGGAGGGGGDGGTRGLGASNNDDSDGNGGHGGDGGDGGDGGCGGSGGGGPSVGVWGLGSSTVRLENGSSVAAGNGGSGGSACGSTATTGVSSNTRTITVQ